MILSALPLSITPWPLIYLLGVLEVFLFYIAVVQLSVYEPSNFIVKLFLCLDDFMAALSDRRTYFAAQVKRTKQKKAIGIVEPDIQQVEGAGSGKKQSKSKKETQNVCIIIWRIMLIKELL